MSDSNVWRITGRIIADIERDEDEMAVFASALSEASGYSVFPGCTRIQTNEPVKLKPEKVVKLGLQQRMVVPAKLNQQPVIISHQWPLKPPLLQRFFVFAEADLLETLELEVGSRVRMEVARQFIGRAHVLDWAKSLSNVLDSGIDR